MNPTLTLITIVGVLLALGILLYFAFDDGAIHIGKPEPHQPQSLADILGPPHPPVSFKSRASKGFTADRMRANELKLVSRDRRQG